MKNEVRLIGGLYRRRKLPVADRPGLRPTPDRVRETLFNWLGQDLSGRTTLDLYAGTGAMSVEALSRGAARAVAVDRDPGLALALESNARAIGLDAIEVHRGDARRHLERETRDFDVIFADPPYGEDPWPWLLPACAARLSPGGVVYAEAGRALEAPEGLVLVRHGRAGQVHYHLYARC